MNLNSEQAAKIHDLESYKSVTGSRFRRTKEEIASGLSNEDALKKRLGKDSKTKPQVVALKSSGGFTIKIKPEGKVDADYFEHIPTESIEICLDQGWYVWFDSLASKTFEGNISKLMKTILDSGMSVVLTEYQFPSDLK